MEWVTVAAWVLATAGLAALAAPPAAAVFARFDGRGGELALPLGLVVLGLASFWVGHLRYGWPALLAAVAALAAASGAALRRGAVPVWPAVARGYGAFLVGFLGSLLVRATTPTIGPAGGEQFLHYGLLRAVGRAARLPPEDMWFAGETVRYYYGGHTLVDQLARLTWTEPRLAYNLGLALVFGLAVAAAYGLGREIAAGIDREPGLGGAASAGILVLAGTPTTPVRLLVGALPADLAETYGAFAFRAIRRPEPIATVIEEQGSLATWFWWHDRYVVLGTLQEFPSYSLLKADLHGHVTAIPFTVLALALAYVYYRTPASDRRRRLAILLGAFPALAGFLGWVNLWSLPGAVGVAWLAAALAPAGVASLLTGGLRGRATPADGRRRLAVRLGGATLLAGLVGALAYLWIAPFVLFQLPTNDGVGFLPEGSPIETALLVWGGFLALFALVLMPALRRRIPGTGREAGLVLAVAVAAVAVATGLGVGWAALLSVVLVGAFALAWEADRLGFVWLAVLGGLGLVLSMELVYAEVWPPELERWNTTYKVSMQAWILCAMAAGAVVAELVGRVRTAPPSPGSVATGAALVVVLLGLAAFPVLGVGGQVGDYATDDYRQPLSLDALDGHERWQAEEVAAIEWLDDRDGTPVVLEAPGRPAYSWVNPASSLTGLPTVAGWEHQRGYRGVEAYEERVAAVDAMYTGEPATVVDLLRAFDVRYVWVGEAEYERYGRSVDRIGGLEGVSVAFENDAVTVYRVDHAGLAA